MTLRPYLRLYWEVDLAEIEYSIWVILRLDTLLNVYLYKQYIETKLVRFRTWSFRLRWPLHKLISQAAPIISQSEPEVLQEVLSEPGQSYCHQEMQIYWEQQEEVVASPEVPRNMGPRINEFSHEQLPAPERQRTSCWKTELSVDWEDCKDWWVVMVMVWTSFQADWAEVLSWL